ncbi:hypothetical protein QYM36_008099, partial [Artemia franciscana]
MTYLQCHFGNSMVDADIYLLQLCSTQIKPSTFLMTVIEKFHVLECLSLSPNLRYSYLEPDQEMLMIESCLTFLASLMSIRTYIGKNDSVVFLLEVLSILCMGDKTHSQLLELLPEKCGSPQTKDIDAFLTEVADYKAPAFEASGTLQQGMYVPKAEVWEKLYDPIYVLLRAVHRREFQSSMDRFTEYIHQTNRYKGKVLWPPFRPPSEVHPSHIDPRVILTSSTFVAFSLVILEKFLTNSNAVSEQALSFCIYLLDMGVSYFGSQQHSGQELMVTSDNETDEFVDMKFNDWFPTEHLPDNLCKTVDKVVLQEVTTVSFQSSDGGEMYEESSDADMDVSEITSEVADQSAGSSQPQSNLLALEGQPSSSSLIPALSSIPSSVSSSSISRRALMAGNELVPMSNTAGLALIRTSGPNGDTYRPVGTIPALAAGNEVVLSESVSSEPIYNTGRQAMTYIPMASLGSRSEGTSSLPPAIFGSSQQEKVDVNANVISLLLKIHTKLSGVNDSYSPPPEQQSTSEEDQNDSCIGDGPFFLGKLLDKIWKLDEKCRNCINESRRTIWPRTQEMIDQETREKEAKEKEERKRKAKERQQKLMAEFASKQKSFIDKYKAMETEPIVEEVVQVEDTESVMIQRREEYDCVICNQTSPSTSERPMCLVILTQSTSTAGHRRCAEPEPGNAEGLKPQTTWVLPLKDQDKDILKKSLTLGSEMEKKIDKLKQHFDEESWLLSVNNGWEGGVYIQTCGHHLHIDCHKSYVQSLRTSQRSTTLATDKGEYSCPLCRQQSNAALPLAPELGDVMTLVSSQQVAPNVLARMIHGFLVEEPAIPPSQLGEAMAKAMEDITSTTYARYRQSSRTGSSSGGPASFFMFVNSVARQSLEVELVMRGDSVTGPPLSKFQSMMVPKHRKSCFVPLVHVLALHSKILRTQQHNAVWSKVTGIPAEVKSTTLLPAPVNEVPLLLRDAVALVLQFVLVLPLHLDKVYLSCLISAFYNLVFYQCVAQVICKMSQQKLELIRNSQRDSDNNSTLLKSLRLVLNRIESRVCNKDENSEQIPSSVAELLYDVELELQKMCLPYLRIMSLLMHHFYAEALPQGVTRNETEECVLLLRFLGLISSTGPILTSPGDVLMEVDAPGPSTSEETASSSSSITVNSLQRTKASIVKASSCEGTKLSSDPVFFVTSEAIKWICEPEESIRALNTWFGEFNMFAQRSQSTARWLMLSYKPWCSPKLLELPHSYDPLFQ